MYGLEQGGITATIQYVLGLFDSETQNKLVKNVFLTGGPASLPGLKPRIERELLAMRPFESQFSVSLAKVCRIFPVHSIINVWDIRGNAEFSLFSILLFTFNMYLYAP